MGITRLVRYLTLAVSLVSSTAWAVDLKYGKDCDSEDLTTCAHPLQRGEAAPFEGQLITTQLAIKLGQKAYRCDAHLKLELVRVQELADIRARAQEDILTIERDAALHEKEILERRLEEALQGPPWYERPVVVALGTALATVAVFALTVSVSR